MTDSPAGGLSFVRGYYNGASVVDAQGQTPDFSTVYSISFAGLQVETAGPGNFTLFAGTDANNHFNLWVTDGTSAGTSELSVAGASANGLQPTGLVVLGNKVLFAGIDAANHKNLWISDGTANGTTELSVGGAYASGLSPTNLTQIGGRVFFSGIDARGQTSVWVSDGTASGTSKLSINGLSGSASGFTALGSNVVFSDGKSLWITDGTTAGTSKLSVAGASSTYGLQPSALIAFGGKVLFSGEDSTNHYGLWVTDGTSAGTSELFAGFGSAPTLFAQFGGKAMFRGAGAQPDVWVSDGTVAGTTEFYIPGAASAYTVPLAAMSDRVLFVGNDTGGRLSLWSSDGTLAGTSELSVAGAFVGGSGGGIFTQMTPYAVTLGGKTYFTGRDANTLLSLFVTDGTSAGSYKIVVNGAATTGLNPTNLSVADGKIFFDGVDASGRTSLWSSDGTSAGTVEMSLSQGGSLAPGPFGTVTTPATASVVSFTGSPASGVLHAGDTVTFTMTMSSGVTVSGGTPTLTLNDGGVAVYNAAATAALGDPTEMVFSYKVGASDLPESSLSFVRGDQNGAVIVDSSGNGPDFSGAFATSFFGIQVATTPTAVTSVIASPSNGVENPGDTVTFTITMNRAVTISGGTPTLTLNDGGIATYDVAATAALGDPAKMVFNYTVGASDAEVNGLSFVRGDQNGAVIVDAQGKGPDLSGIFTASFPGLQIAPAAVIVITIPAQTTFEIPSASTANLAFPPGGAALQLDHSTAFAGSLTGFGGGDSIDLADIAFNGTGTTLGYLSNDSSTGGHLAVSDGTHAAALTLLGQYSAASFALSADGHGGTLITAADTTNQPQLAAHV